MTERRWLGSLDRTVRMCTGKKHFASRAKANKWIRHANWSHDKKMRAYPCQICSGYHLTSKPEFRQ